MNIKLHGYGYLYNVHVLWKRMNIATDSEVCVHIYVKFCINKSDK